MAPWPGDKFLNQFRHLFYYGYDAGYYSYYWADIISADIHAVFAEAGLDNATAMAEVGRKYRWAVTRGQMTACVCWFNVGMVSGQHNLHA
jgi:Zn-dependent oligopeptidase